MHEAQTIQKPTIPTLVEQLSDLTTSIMLEREELIKWRVKCYELTCLLGDLNDKLGYSSNKT